MLDVGCGYGLFLDEIKKTKKCDVSGIEISEHAYLYSKNELSLNVLNCELTSSIFKSESFDVVFLLGTIEHLEKPKEILSIIYGLLKPEGLLVITTLNTKSLIPFYAIKPPEHLFYFNSNNLILLLKNTGYKIIYKKVLFVYYYIHTLVHIFIRFLSLSKMDFVIKLLEKLPKISIKFITNEMCIVASKENNQDCIIL
ncbi:class I SAM-dependent methyltransferase [candidate division KSB1 bacterium]